jgi:hypothetical protein
LHRREETLIPLPQHVDATTSVRSTVLLTSLQALRARGFYERYVSLLTPSSREEIAALAGQWVPVSVAMAHYAACDGLELPEEEIVSIGASVGLVANRSTLSAVVRLAKEAGVTPWAPLGMIDKILGHSWVGGAITVIKIGPKDARLEWHEQPCAASRYFRLGFVGVLTELGGLFSSSPFVKMIEARSGDTFMSYRLQWV